MMALLILWSDLMGRAIISVLHAGPTRAIGKKAKAIIAVAIGGGAWC